MRLERPITIVTILLVGSALLACGDDAVSGETDGELVGSADTEEATGDVSSLTAETQAVGALLGASIERVFLDTEALLLLGITETNKRANQDCYEREDVGALEYRYDFDDCPNTDGHMTVKQIPVGLVVATFEGDFTINQVGIVGSLALEREGVVRTAYTVTDSEVDGEGRSPLVVTDLVAETSSDVTVDGHVEASLLGGELAIWGAGVSDDGTTETSFLFGASSSNASSSDQPATALVWDLPRRDCDCPNDGTMWYEATTLAVDGVTVDLDDYQRNDDGEDDFAPFEVPIDVSVSGELALNVTGCGTFEADFNADIDVSVDLGRTPLVEGLDIACDRGDLASSACDRIRSYLDRQANIDINVSIPDTRLDDVAREALDARFDRSICG